MKKRGFKRVGILCPNTPAFLESIFGIGAAGAVNIGEFIAFYVFCVLLLLVGIWGLYADGFTLC